jgi:hypothetical protein
MAIPCGASECETADDLKCASCGSEGPWPARRLTICGTVEALGSAGKADGLGPGVTRGMSTLIGAKGWRVSWYAPYLPYV